MKRPVTLNWAAGYGRILGEVIDRRGNAIHVRFKTVTSA